MSINSCQQVVSQPINVDYDLERDIILQFMNKLKDAGYVGYITGGHAFKQWVDEKEKTSDWDIHIYLTTKQMKNPKNYENIYNLIKELYIEYKNQITNLDRLVKFDYAKWSSKYIGCLFRNKMTEYYNSNVICDIQFENELDTFVDISISCSFDMKEIENKIDNHYISIDCLEKDLSKYLEDLKNGNEEREKILKVKSRLERVKKIIN